MFKVQLAASVWMMVAVGCASSQGRGEEKAVSEEEAETEQIDTAEEDTEVVEAPDADGDGLSDEDEAIARTDSLNPDTDDDGYSDWSEERDGSDPNSPLSMPRKAVAPSTSRAPTSSTSRW